MGVRIRQLPAAVANQIAAGEVIERPASVVKELLENAYDAKASAISVELAHGGLNQIIITDNGHGIVAEDLPLSIMAHATSKIEKADDLFQLSSMGFRGEALASIASVSRLTIRSKTADAQHAMELQVENGKPKMQPCAHNTGTMISVYDLFYNIPVRKKFLKSERLEYLAIEAVVKCFAMSAPHIALQLKHNNKTVLSLPAASHEANHYKRMLRLFGQNFADTAIVLDAEHLGMRVKGWLSHADYQRSQNDRCWIYVNQRMVKDKLLQHALKQAYESVLHPGRFPACLLYLNLPVTEVDVNVHPAKQELRFQQPRLVHDFLRSQLQSALMHNSSIESSQAIKSPTPLSVQESVPRFELSRNHLTSQDACAWVILSKRFVVLPVEDKSYLLDTIKIQQVRLYEHLHEQSLPLASRPLLVPVAYSLKVAHRDYLKEQQHALNQLGMVLEFPEDNQVRVTGIPVAMPQIEISTFLEGFFDKNLESQSALLSYMTSCQSFDLKQVSAEEKRYFQTYVESNLAHLCGQRMACLITEERCEALLDA